MQTTNENDRSLKIHSIEEWDPIIIQNIRLDLGLTGKEYSKLTGINPSDLSNYENGHRKPSLKNLFKILSTVKGFIYLPNHITD